jgi:hypothetical protein
MTDLKIQPDELPAAPEPLAPEDDATIADQAMQCGPFLMALKGHNVMVSMNNGKFYIGLLNGTDPGRGTFFVGNSGRLSVSDVKTFRET